jgi:ligand-binding SRPBCC domain-containing protein
VQTITVETRIAAPPERCFLLSLNIDLHVQSAAPTRERAVAGVTHGLIGLGERVTWEGRHFGLKLRHETLITACERPKYFQDAMVNGLFRSFVHDHYFETAADADTAMRDVLRFAAPLGPLGSIAEALVLKRYLQRFLVERNQVIRRVAESSPEVWQPFVIERI